MEIQSQSSVADSSRETGVTNSSNTENENLHSEGALKSSLETQKLALKLIRSSGINIDVKA